MFSGTEVVIGLAFLFLSVVSYLLVSLRSANAERAAAEQQLRKINSQLQQSNKSTTRIKKELQQSKSVIVNLEEENEFLTEQSDSIKKALRDKKREVERLQSELKEIKTRPAHKETKETKVKEIKERQHRGENAEVGVVLDGTKFILPEKAVGCDDLMEHMKDGSLTDSDWAFITEATGLSKCDVMRAFPQCPTSETDDIMKPNHCLLKDNNIISDPVKYSKITVTNEPTVDTSNTKEHLNDTVDSNVDNVDYTDDTSADSGNEGSTSESSSEGVIKCHEPSCDTETWTAVDCLPLPDVDITTVNHCHHLLGDAMSSQQLGVHFKLPKYIENVDDQWQLKDHVRTNSGATVTTFTPTTHLKPSTLTLMSVLTIEPLTTSLHQYKEQAKQNVINCLSPMYFLTLHRDRCISVDSSRGYELLYSQVLPKDHNNSGALYLWSVMGSYSDRVVTIQFIINDHIKLYELYPSLLSMAASVKLTSPTHIKLHSPPKLPSSMTSRVEYIQHWWRCRRQRLWYLNAHHRVCQLQRAVRCSMAYRQVAKLRKLMEAEEWAQDLQLSELAAVIFS